MTEERLCSLERVFQNANRKTALVCFLFAKMTHTSQKWAQWGQRVGDRHWHDSLRSSSDTFVFRPVFFSAQSVSHLRLASASCVFLHITPLHVNKITLSGVMCYRELWWSIWSTCKGVNWGRAGRRECNEESGSTRDRYCLLMYVQEERCSESGMKEAESESGGGGTQAEWNKEEIKREWRLLYNERLLWSELI